MGSPQPSSRGRSLRYRARRGATAHSPTSGGSASRFARAWVRLAPGPDRGETRRHSLIREYARVAVNLRELSPAASLRVSLLCGKRHSVRVKQALCKENGDSSSYALCGRFLPRLRPLSSGRFFASGFPGFRGRSLRCRVRRGVVAHSPTSGGSASPFARVRSAGASISECHQAEPAATCLRGNDITSKALVLNDAHSRLSARP
jgi:hypothetical protein